MKRIETRPKQPRSGFGVGALLIASLTSSAAFAQNNMMGVNPNAWTQEYIRSIAGTETYDTAEHCSNIVPLDHTGRPTFWWIGPAELTPISTGDIVIADRVITDLDPKGRDIAMVFQKYAPYPNKTVYNNLDFPLRMRKLSKSEIEAKVSKAASLLKIIHLLDTYPRELSGRQQQRVILGRALVRDRSAFLMEESLSNLDAKLRVQMRSELKRCHHNLKATIVYVTHEQMEAMTMTDKVAVMSDGFLQQYDTPKQVFDNPANTFVASFIGLPAMSLVPLELGSGAGRPALLSSAGWTLTLSDENARKSLKSTTKKVVMGVRHSTIRIHKHEVSGAIPGRVHTTEPTGDITYAQVILGEFEITVSVEPTVPLGVDEAVWVEFDQARIHLFDGETQDALKL